MLPLTSCSGSERCKTTAWAVASSTRPESTHASQMFAVFHLLIVLRQCSRRRCHARKSTQSVVPTLQVCSQSVASHTRLAMGSERSLQARAEVTSRSSAAAPPPPPGASHHANRPHPVVCTWRWRGGEGTEDLERTAREVGRAAVALVAKVVATAKCKTYMPCKRTTGTGVPAHTTCGGIREQRLRSDLKRLPECAQAVAGWRTSHER